MKTFKLKHNKINITDWCNDYSCMFRKLYTNFELSADKGFQKELREKYRLDSWFFDSCLNEVKLKIAQNETQKKKKLIQIEELQKSIESGDKDESNKGIKARRLKSRQLKKLNYLTTHIDKEITFGTKSILRKISYLPNYISQINYKISIEKDKIKFKEYEKELLKSESELIEFKDKYQNNRVLSILSVGEAPQKSNRKFDFDFVNKKMVFKPQQGTKIPIEFKCSKQQHSELIKLQSQVGEQPITVRIDNDYVYISFDNEKLNGFAFDEREFLKELKQIPKDEKALRTACSKRWHKEQETRRFRDKNINRYLSIDLNPEYIGFAILEKVGEGFKVIFKSCIDLTGLNTRLGLSSTDEKQVYQNNKRVHEIYEIWKKIFSIASRFNVSHCVIEDLEFKDKGVNTNSNEANRKTKNIWHRTITTTAIQKYCHERGIKQISVNACYSSFIGNIKNEFFDPVSASIEIGRRGIKKYLKGEFYPKLERIDLDTMYELGLDVPSKTISNWVSAYKLFKTSGLRYRRENIFSLENNLSSYKSCVKYYNY